MSRARWVLERWAALAVLVAVFAAVMTLSVITIATATAEYAALVNAKGRGADGFPGSRRAHAGHGAERPVLGRCRRVWLPSPFGVAWLAGLIETFGSAVGNGAMVNIGIAVSLGITSDAMEGGLLLRLHPGSGFLE